MLVLGVSGRRTSGSAPNAHRLTATECACTLPGRPHLAASPTKADLSKLYLLPTFGLTRPLIDAPGLQRLVSLAPQGGTEARSALRQPCHLASSMCAHTALVFGTCRGWLACFGCCARSSRTSDNRTVEVRVSEAEMSRRGLRVKVGCQGCQLMYSYHQNAKCQGEQQRCSASC